MEQQSKDRVRSQLHKNLQDYLAADSTSDRLPSQEELDKRLKRNDRLLIIAIIVFVIGVTVVVCLNYKNLMQ